jgi:GDPmannose 4,6-dehydratase
VKEFIDESFRIAGIEIEWKGSGVDEKGLDKKSGKVLVEINPKYFRPTEVELLIGDPAKAKQKLGWEPKVKFKELVKIMTEADLKKAGV